MTKCYPSNKYKNYSSDILHSKNNKKKLASKNSNDSKPMFIARDQSRIASHLTDRVVPRLY